MSFFLSSSKSINMSWSWIILCMISRNVTLESISMENPRKYSLWNLYLLWLRNTLFWTTVSNLFPYLLYSVFYIGNRSRRFKLEGGINAYRSRALYEFRKSRSIFHSFKKKTTKRVDRNFSWGDYFYCWFDQFYCYEYVSVCLSHVHIGYSIGWADFKSNLSGDSFVDCYYRSCIVYLSLGDNSDFVISAVVGHSRLWVFLPNLVVYRMNACDFSSHHL